MLINPMSQNRLKKLINYFFAVLQRLKLTNNNNKNIYKVNYLCIEGYTYYKQYYDVKG